jgi:hypothetical protein
MNRNIYIREEDEEVWKRAQILAGAKGLSTVVVQGLKKFIAEKDADKAQAKGFERIVVEFNDSEAHFIPKIKAFYGKWIFPPTKPELAGSDEGDTSWRCSVAITVKGNAVFYQIEEEQDGRRETFRVFPTLEAAAADKHVHWAALRAVRAIGVPVEELDI